MKIGDLVGKYIALRDKKKEIADRHREELAPFNEALLKIETVFANHMREHGQDSIHTPDGTAYTQERVSTKVEDWDALLAFVRETGAWHLLEQRAAKAAVIETLEEGVEVPGVSVRRENVVNVRRTT